MICKRKFFLTTMAVSNLYKYVTYSDVVIFKTVKLLIGTYNPSETHKQFSIFQRYLQRPNLSTKIIKLFIKHGADVDGLDAEMSTPLCTILTNIKDYKTKPLNIILLFIENGANINKKTLDGNNPLCCMLSNKYINSLENIIFMIENGADVFANDNKNFNTLQVYLQSGCNIDINVIKLLLDKGVNINQHNNEYGYTSLHCYFKTNVSCLDVDIAKFLIDNGLIINKFNKQNRKNFIYVIDLLILNKKFNKDIFDLIFSYIDINDYDVLNINPIYYSIYYNNKKAFRYLLNAGGDINIVTSLGNTCLYTAFENESKYMFNSILNSFPNNNVMEQTFYRLNTYVSNKENTTFDELELLLIRKCIAYFILYNKDYNIKLYYPYIFTHFKYFIKYCKKVIDELSNTYVENISIFDIFFKYKKFKSVPIKYVKNKKIIGYSQLFYYGEIIQKILNLSKRRYNNINKTILLITKICDNELNYWNYLPNEIKFKIIDNLSNNEILETFF
ncbi:ankyrin repeat protein [Deerpox virus W-848-83]|uniref:Ankyrin repeat protein n=1 Tax=Deerpox virus (strain Mule deer/United States/W-848-83/1983) TaxID=305674 RepID=Q08FI6_DPV83|nr:Ankyrin repeat protein [Deerpox virus W-848-83]ABI99321.1 ankyrin repeat protein [Deerpox virus W-848-83]